MTGHGSPVWTHGDIFETSEEQAQIFESLKHAIRIKEPDEVELAKDEPIKEVKKRGRKPLS